jgi:hypothetical protein
MVERRNAQRSLVRIRETAPGRSEAPTRVAQAPPKLKSPLTLAIMMGLLVAIFGYVSLSATLTAKTSPRIFFGLSVAHTNSGLRLLWNPSAAALRGVTEAELRIVDGDHYSQLLLSPGQIRSGNLFYAPFTGEVRFNLRAQGGGRIATETVLALNQRTGESTTLQGAVTFPAAASPDLLSNLTAVKSTH